MAPVHRSLNRRESGVHSGLLSLAYYQACGCHCCFSVLTALSCWLPLLVKSTPMTCWMGPQVPPPLLSCLSFCFSQGLCLRHCPYTPILLHSHAPTPRQMSRMFVPGRFSVASCLFHVLPLCLKKFPSVEGPS